MVNSIILSPFIFPCSYYQLQDWYYRSALPFFLELQASDLTYPVSLNALDYLQPETTIPVQVALYKNINRVYGYNCDRLDIDLTSTYFEGEECILAEFGHSRDHPIHPSKKLQIEVFNMADNEKLPEVEM